MREFLSSSAYFGALISLLYFGLGLLLSKKWKSALVNPLLIAVALTIFTLSALGIDYESYVASAKPLSYLLTPATICLAIPLYEQFRLFRENAGAVLAGVASGVLTNLCCIALLTRLFGLDRTALITLLPKSVTTAIGMGISQELGGNVSVTVAAIILTGITGNLFAGVLCRLCRITNPVAKGIAVGSASHAIGTAKAMEMGEAEGAMSSLSIVLSGMLTVAAAALLSPLL